MKKIINGKKYDTDTARMVKYWSNGRFSTDFSFEAETLYRKKTGEYFLHGEGGARTRYAVYFGDNDWGGGEAIEPLSYEAAEEWAERRMDADEYEAEFGEVDEGGSERVSVTVRISEAARARLQRESSRRGVTQGEVIESLLSGLS